MYFKIRLLMFFTELPLKKGLTIFWNCVRFCIWCTLSVPSLSIERSTGPFSQIFSLCLKFGHSCSSPYNPKNNKKSKVDKSTLDFLVRWKGLEPPTYWFVAAKIWLKYSKYGYFKPFLLYKICPQFHRSFYSLIIYILQVVTIVVKIQLQAYWILIRILYTDLVDDFADNLKLISNNIEKFNN